MPLQGKAAGGTPKDLDWWRGYITIGRLRRGVSAASAHTSLNTLFQRMQEEWVAEFGAMWTQNEREQFVEQKLTMESSATGWSGLRMEFGKQLSVLMAAVASVLFIACVNVAVLLLARGAVRRKELAIRLSIGSSRSRLVRQLLIESLTIASLSAILGLAIAYWATQLLLSYTPALAGLDVRPDARILAFTVATAVASALAFGLFPALRSTKTDLNPALKDVQVPLSYRRPRFQLNKVLIASQVALSLVLLVGAGLFVRTLRNLSSIDTGERARSSLFAVRASSSTDAVARAVMVAVKEMDSLLQGDAYAHA